MSYQQIIPIDDDQDTEPEDNVSARPIKYRSNNETNVKKRPSTSQEVINLDDEDTEPEDVDETSIHHRHKSIKSSTTSKSSTSTTSTKSIVDSLQTDYDEDLEYAIQQSLLESKQIQQQKQQERYNSIGSSGETFYLNRITGENSSTLPLTLTFREMISVNELESVIAMGFGMDVEWMVKEITRSQGRRNDIPMTFVIDTGDPKEKGTKYYNGNQNIKLIFSHVLYGCMHCKLILLRFKDNIRVLVPSANPSEADYIHIGQTIWFQDFKKQSSLPYISSPSSIEFRDTLKTLLNCFKIETKFLDQYDYSDAKAQLIISLPGFHNGKVLNSYGHLKLRSILTKYYNEKEKELPKMENLSRDVYSQCSSLGNVNSTWNTHFLESCRIPKNCLQDITKSFHILFPTESWITSNRSRILSSSIIRFQDKYYNDKTFPRSSMNLIRLRHQHRGNMVLHTKVNVGVSTIGNNKRLDWIYIGSHNLSPAAWGKVQKNETQLQLSNYEIGVVLLNDKRYDDFAPPCWENQIPFNIPASPYSSTDKPFFIDNFANSLSK